MRVRPDPRKEGVDVLVDAEQNPQEIVVKLLQEPEQDVHLGADMVVVERKVADYHIFKVGQSCLGGEDRVEMGRDQVGHGVGERVQGESPSVDQNRRFWRHFNAVLAEASDYERVAC